MSETVTKVDVEIFGENYVIRGNEGREHVLMLANYVDKKMKQFSNRNPRLSASKVAVLTALNIADELSKLQEDYDNLVKLIEDEKKK
ncbi:MAG: cell division protein ZapA [Clostridia bacterium]|nr:cell division protein ZapA [Clostridia bacterium]